MIAPLNQINFSYTTFQLWPELFHQPCSINHD